MGHYIAAISIPSFLVLVGILLNQRGHDKADARIDRLEASLDRRFDKVDSRLDRIQADLHDFHRSLGQHGKAIEVLEKKL